MINILLAALTEVLEIQKDHTTGNADIDSVLESKKRFAQALGDFIDYRVQSAFEERRKYQSQERIQVADSINLAVKSTASTIKTMVALNSAPPPPENIEDMEKWRKVYREWYETKRQNGMTIG
jgi:hypothetical protein